MGYALSDILRRDGTSAAERHVAAPRPRQIANSLPASVFDPSPAEPEPETPSRAEALEPAEPVAVSTPSTRVEVPLPPTTPQPPGHLTPEQMYSWWLSRMHAGDAEVIETWPSIYLAARSIGLTRLGRGHYTAAAFRRACERLVREGWAVRFWLVQRGRPRRAATTMAHLWAFGIAGFHRRLGRRDSIR